MATMSPQQIAFHSTILLLLLNVVALGFVSGDRCSHRNSCKERVLDNENLEEVDCHCGEMCSTYGTCCADSKHRNGLWTHFKCVRPYGMQTQPLFMVGTCNNRDADAYAENKCRGNGEKLNDPFYLVPVTSQKTNITYRNYFCYACNEYYLDPPVSWDLELYSNELRVKPNSLTNLRFDPEKEKWKINNRTVYLKMKIPDGLQHHDIRCDASVIQTCAKNWTNRRTKNKCKAYMALARVRQENGETKTYRNPHCAICNYVDKSRIRCGSVPQHQGGGLPIFLGLFSLHDKVHKCPKNKHYDSISKKCRGFVCGKNQIEWRGFCRNKTSSCKYRLSFLCF